MSETIEAGIIDKISDMFNKLFKNLPGFDSPKAKKVKDKEREGVLYTVLTGNEKECRVKVLPASGRSDKFDVYVIGDGDKKGYKTGISLDDVNKFITDFVDSNYTASVEDVVESTNGDDFDIEKEFGDVESCFKIAIRMTPVEGSNESELTGIYAEAGIDVGNIAQDLINILGDDEFAASLPEEEVCYEVSVDPEGYDVDVMEECELPAPTTEDEYNYAVKRILSMQYYILFTLHAFTEYSHQTTAAKALIHSHIDKILMDADPSADVVSDAISDTAYALKGYLNNFDSEQGTPNIFDNPFSDYQTILETYFLFDFSQEFADLLDALLWDLQEAY